MNPSYTMLIPDADQASNYKEIDKICRSTYISAPEIESILDTLLRLMRENKKGSAIKTSSDIFVDRIYKKAEESLSFKAHAFNAVKNGIICSVIRPCVKDTKFLNQYIRSELDRETDEDLRLLRVVAMTVIENSSRTSPV